MNAFNDLIGFGGDVFAASAPGQAFTRARQAGRRRDASGDVRDLVLSGDFKAAERRAVEGGLVDPLAFANVSRTRETERQTGQTQSIMNLASFVDGLAPDQQGAYLQAHGEILKSALDLDDEDFAVLTGTVGVPGGFRALAQSTITPQAQIENRQAGAEIGAKTLTAQTGAGRLGLDREKFAFEQENQPQESLKQRFDQEAKLRGDFQKFTKDLQEMNGSIDRLNTVASQKTSQGDLALVVAFTKLLDPGSVAREGEVALTRSSQSLLQMAQNLTNTWVEGQTILHEDARQRFVETANAIAEESDKIFQRRVDDFTRTAEEFKLNPQNVVIGGGDPRVPRPSGFKEGQTATNPQTGQQIIYRNGSWEPR